MGHNAKSLFIYLPEVLINVSIPTMEENRIETMLLGVIALILLGAVMKLASSVMLPLVIAGILAVTLSPLINFFYKNLHIPRNFAVILVIAVVFGVVFLIVLFIQSSIGAFIDEYPKYSARFSVLNTTLVKFIEEKVGISYDFFGQIEWSGTLLKYLGSLSSSLVSFASSGLVIMIFLIFMLLENPFAPKKLILAFKVDNGEKISKILNRITAQVVKYLNLKFFISIGTGILVWFSLFLIGLDFAPMWGVFAFLLNFIPSVGSVILMVITILMGFIQFYPEPGRIIAVIISMVGIQTVIGNFIDPRLQASRLDISPIVILFSLVFWGWIWGIVGMFLAVPLTVIIQIICQNIPFLYPVSILIGSGRKLENIEDEIILETEEPE
ncbi:MAG: AI-2E family transporter [Spirochaetota bacterium]|nr:AI-2E family transporter [Spirochaetota bacterium]